MSHNYLQKLNYNIVNISSTEDESLNPAKSIISFDNSWTSERFCIYPQQIIIQFDSPVNLRQINIISHEKKISEKISFFSFCPQKDIFIPNSKIMDFENIGFINLNQNFASNYQVRELKRIFVNIKCLYLKIELDKNYINDYNPYHQVGIINLDFYGHKLPGYNNILNKKQNIYKNEEISKVEEIEPNINNNNNYNNLIDEINGEKIKQLNNKLEESNKNQNFKECKYYKELISKAKELGNKIYNLQLEKNEAIKIEDYDKATELKETIDISKSQLYNLGQKTQRRNSSMNNIDNNNLDINNNSINNENDNNLDNNTNNNTKYNIKNNSFYLSNNNSKSFDSYNNNRQNSPSSYNTYNNTKNKISEIDEKYYNQYDDMIVPAVQKKLKSNKSQEELDLENEELYKLELSPLEELEKDKIGNYVLLVPFIQEIGLQKLLSSQIIYKIEGIKILKNELSKIFISSDLNEIIPILFELIANFLEDKNNSLTLKTFELIEQLFQYMNVNIEKININKNLLNFICNRIIQKIINYLSDGVEKIRTKATELFLHIIYQNVINFNLLINNLLHKDVINKDNDHYSISPISILCKLSILKHILKNYTRIINCNISTKENFPKNIIIEYLLMNINNSKNNIKDNCREVCILAFEHFGSEAFRNKLSFLDKKEFEKLFKIKTLEPMMKSISTNSLDGSGNNSKNNSPIKNKKNQNQNLCSLCKQDIGKEKIINHMKKCAMCCRCKKCKIFVEIKNLTNHKLNDCKYKNEYKLCNRCKEAIHIKSYKIHVENKKCNPWKSNYNRCPLCHGDIPSNNRGFFQHLMKDGCPTRSEINNTTEQGI